MNLYSYKIKRKGISKYKDYKNELQKIKKDGNAPSTTGETPSEENKINMLSLNDKILYYENDIFDNSINNEQNTKKANKFKIFKEYLIPIVHYIYDPTQRISKKENPIHTVIDDPIDITKMEEKLMHLNW